MLSRFFGASKRSFDSLSEQEILALAISSEEDDGRIYRAYADGLRDDYPSSAKVFDEMAAEEDEHRRRLIETHRQRFGETIPLIRREHVREDRRTARVEDEHLDACQDERRPPPRRVDAVGRQARGDG